MTCGNKRELTSEAYITGITNLDSSAQINSNRKSLQSNAFIQYKKQTIVCDGEIMDDIVEEFGTEITVRVVSKTFDPDDDYGNATETYNDYTRYAMVMSYTASDDEVKEGVFQAGEVLFVFRISDEGYVKPGNRIMYAGQWYEIKEIVKQPMMDVLYYLQARVQKI